MCNYSSGISDSRKHSSCFLFVYPLCHKCINSQVFSSTRHISVSLKHIISSTFMLFCLLIVLIFSSHDSVGTLLVAFHKVVISRLSVCCSLDWLLAYQLYSTASALIVTISACPWALTNPEGHKLFVCLFVFVFVCVCVCVFPQVSETLGVLI